ncbi:MAG: hypothetical protein FWG23_06940 [Eggerthellaceae bacterium]|nr:hypothetical protein [Eggerthellaceae bacterium]MDR2715795.1 hypothetical protein [Coriobacteriaceae bacterium]
MDLNGSKFFIKHNTPGGEQHLHVTFSLDGGTLGGTCVNGDIEYPLINGAVNGDEVEFGYIQDTPMGKMKLHFKGKVAGDDYEGKVKLGGPYGFRAFKGVRE